MLWDPLIWRVRIATWLAALLLVAPMTWHNWLAGRSLAATLIELRLPGFIFVLLRPPPAEACMGCVASTREQLPCTMCCGRASASRLLKPKAIVPISLATAHLFGGK